MRTFTLDLLLGLMSAPLALAQASGPSQPPLPVWVNAVGATHVPSGGPAYLVSDYGAVGDGATLATSAIQRAIDICSSTNGGVVTFKPGTYLTGALFIKSGVHVRIDEGVTILATQEESQYPIIPTRVAGIEMPWPAALININGQENVEISGKGTIDGNGEVWWKKYWALRKVYEGRGIRWAADYDCQRVRLMVAFRSKDVTVSGLRLRRSGFWTVQVTYCDHVTVDGVRIVDNAVIDGVKGPSTDGVDVDSSSQVLVQRCDIDNNDDDICLKAGRDYDGLRVNRPTEYVVIRDNVIRRGGGVVSFGSETSGGIRHVVAYRNTGIGTTEGLRFKSARTRGGTVEDILIRDTTLTRVPFPFTFNQDWNAAYSYARIPPGIKDFPGYWKVLTEPVEPPERGFASFRDIQIESATVTGARQIITATGMAEKPFGPVSWSNVSAEGLKAGEITHARGWTMNNVRFTTGDGNAVKLVDCQNVESPLVSRSK